MNFPSPSHNNITAKQSKKVIKREAINDDDEEQTEKQEKILPVTPSKNQEGYLDIVKLANPNDGEDEAIEAEVKEIMIPLPSIDPFLAPVISALFPPDESSTSTNVKLNSNETETPEETTTTTAEIETTESTTKVLDESSTAKVVDETTTEKLVSELSTTTPKTLSTTSRNFSEVSINPSTLPTTAASDMTNEADRKIDMVRTSMHYKFMGFWDCFFKLDLFLLGKARGEC